MAKGINTTDTIRKILIRTRGLLPGREVSVCVAHLLFTKYVVDNCVGAANKNEMYEFVKAQKLFATRDAQNGTEVLKTIMTIVESAFGLKGVLSNEDIIAKNSEVMFDENGKLLMDELAKIDLEEKNGTNEVGEELADNIVQLITRYATFRSTGSESTNNRLNYLVKRLLSVQKTDLFLDFVAGIGASTIDITKDSKPYVTCVDLDNSAITLATMLLIMCGYSEFSIFNNDTLEGHVMEELKADKIFVDPPLNHRLKKSKDNLYTDATLVAIDRTVHHFLNEGGEAVVTAPSNLLFKQDRQSVMLKKSLICERKISAVIALPPMWERISVGTNLLVLADNNDENVVFVDAFTDNKPKRARRGSLTDEQIENIVDAVKNRKEIEGLSAVINCNEIIENKYDLIPAKYVKHDSVIGETITIDEIEIELNKLYKELFEII